MKTASQHNLTTFGYLFTDPRAVPDLPVPGGTPVSGSLGGVFVFLS